MKLTTTLSILAPIVPNRPTCPILSCVLVEDGKITATDLDNWVEVWTDIHINMPAVVPFKQLKAMAKGKTSLSLTVNEITVTDGSISTQTFPLEEYPHCPSAKEQEEIGTFTIPDCLADVARAASQDELRPNLCGVCFDLTRKTVVATDGNRMHSAPILATETGEAIVGLDAVKILQKMAGATALVYRATPNEVAIQYLSAVSGDLSIVTRCIDANFPDCTKVYPDTTRTWQAPREAFLAMLKNALPLTTKRSPGARFTGGEDGSLAIDVTTPNVGEYHNKICGSGGVSGLQFGLNLNYLINAIEAQGKVDCVKMLTCEPDKDGIVARSMVINGGAITAVVMPMRIF